MDYGYNVGNKTAEFIENDIFKNISYKLILSQGSQYNIPTGMPDLDVYVYKISASTLYH